MYRIFGDSPTIKIVEWLIKNQLFDHSLVEIAGGAGLTIQVAKKNFEPLVTYGVVKESRVVHKYPMYVLDLQSPCTKAIVEFDGKIAKCCEKDSPTIEEDPESSEFTEMCDAHERMMEGPEEDNAEIGILPPEI